MNIFRRVFRCLSGHPDYGSERGHVWEFSRLFDIQRYTIWHDICVLCGVERVTDTDGLYRIQPPGACSYTGRLLERWQMTVSRGARHFERGVEEVRNP